MTLPPGVTGKFDPECRECQAGLYQAKSFDLGFGCPVHGISTYDPTAELKELLRQADPPCDRDEMGDCIDLEEAGHDYSKCKGNGCAWERRRKEVLGE